MRLQTHPFGPFAGVFVHEGQAAFSPDEHAIFRYGVRGMKRYAEGLFGAGDRDRTGDVQLGKLAFYR